MADADWTRNTCLGRVKLLWPQLDELVHTTGQGTATRITPDSRKRVAATSRGECAYDRMAARPSHRGASDPQLRLHDAQYGRLSPSSTNHHVPRHHGTTAFMLGFRAVTVAAVGFVSGRLTGSELQRSTWLPMVTVRSVGRLK